LKRTRGTTLTAIHVQRDSVDIARISHDGMRPKVELCASFQKRGDDLQTLSELRKELRLDRSPATTLLAPGEYQVQLLDAPSVPVAEMKAAARWRLKDSLDYPVEQATIDVLQVPADPNAPTRQRSIYAVASRNDTVAGYMNLFAQAKVQLAVIDIPEMAQRNLAGLFESERRALGFLTFGQERGLLTFTSGNELHVSRPVDVSLPQLLDCDETQKTHLFERVVLEVQRSLDHFDRQFSFIPLSRLMLLAVPEELEAFLRQNLYVAVERARLETVLEAGSATDLQSEEVQARNYLVLGAAMRYEAVS
jgi:MSHA biogenesis protein MshI